MKSVVLFFPTRWCWRWNTIWRTKLVVSFVCMTLVTVQHLIQPWKIDSHNLFYYLVHCKYSLYYWQENISEATKLDNPGGYPEMQSKGCLNDQATIAWFTSTRGVYQVGFLAYKLYSGLMRVHFIEYLWWNIFALCKIFFVLKYFRNNFYNTQVKKNHLRIVRPTLEIVEKCIIHIRICFWN